MAKANSNNANHLSEGVFMTWMEALSKDSVNTPITSQALAEWFCAGRVWATIAPTKFAPFCEKLFTTELAYPVHPSILLIAGLYLTEDHPDRIPTEKILAFHLEVARLLDENHEGLLRHLPSESVNAYLPSVQAAWIWAADSLLNQNIDAGLLEPLLQLRELYIYETDRQCWDNEQGFNRPFPFTELNEPFSLTDNALAMLAWIPDQDRAEEILVWLESNAPPWQEPTVPVTEWLGAASFLLYEALVAYEMTKAARQLKKYVLEHLPHREEFPAKECLLWLWENEH